ncbi:metallophosphoesterase [Microbacterium sp. 18062]|uniref:metallophosphoesterase family protein n=1 Tax=Microbacterium sp. 18062 TaxID=2681410 RepID=UPI001356BD37|nr:metallophosphoesterase [Microbacterium sp. 18062]
MPNLLAVSDLHVGYADNAPFVEDIRPRSAGDWLIVAGDVADRFDQIVATMRTLRDRFDTVVWVPGNHELWTLPGDPLGLRGVARYLRLVRALRDIGVTTPEDAYRVWDGEHGPVVVAPLFLLYDYTFRPAETRSKSDALAVAEAAGVLCTDEVLLHPDPYPTREAWCAARLEHTRARLDALPADARTVLVNHFPLVREPTRRLRYPEFALWCGTEHTVDWPVRYRAEAVVYGHLHIPVTARIDGIPHHEVSLGYPHEWDAPGALPRRVVRVLGDGGGA